METTIACWGYIGIMEKKMETTIVYWGYIVIMEKKTETTMVYWGYTRIFEKKMEATTLYYSVLWYIMVYVEQEKSKKQGQNWERITRTHGHHSRKWRCQ